MFRKMAGVVVAVMLTGGVAHAQEYWTLEGVTGSTAWFSGDKQHTEVLTNIAPNVYATTFAGYYGANVWWGWSGLHEWDRYPDPWGEKTWSFTWAGQSTGYGRETVFFSGGATPDTPVVGEAVWKLMIPAQGLVDLSLDAGWQYIQLWISDDGVDFTGVYTQGGAWTREIVPIDPVTFADQFDTSVPGQTTFYLKYRGHQAPGAGYAYQRITATVPPPPPGTTILIH